MSDYINKNKMGIQAAQAAGMSAGAASIKIDINNGAIEVTNINGAVLMQAKNVRAGTFRKIWDVLETCGTTDFIAK